MLCFQTGSLTPVTHEVAESNFNLDVCSSISARFSTQADQPPERICVCKNTPVAVSTSPQFPTRSDALATVLNLPRGEPSKFTHTLIYIYVFLPSHCFSEKCAHLMPKDEPPAAPMPASDSHTWEPNIFHPPILNPREQASSLFGSRDGWKKTRFIYPVTDGGVGYSCEANNGSDLLGIALGKNLRLGFCTHHVCLSLKSCWSSEGWKLNGRFWNTQCRQWS